jgi:hypothetical protein
MFHIPLADACVTDLSPACPLPSKSQAVVVLQPGTSGVTEERGEEIPLQERVMNLSYCFYERESRM